MSGVDKAKNKVEELSGRGKEAVGDATDNRDLQAEGKADKVSGNLKQAGEKVKDAFKK
ncbi:CsbD family protein [Geodermatophilus sp. SYSU D00703]